MRCSHVKTFAKRHANTYKNFVRSYGTSKAPFVLRLVIGSSMAGSLNLNDAQFIF